MKASSVFSMYSRGLETGRDTWVYNYSEKQVSDNMEGMADFYNEQLEKAELSMDTTRIAWTGGLIEKAKKGVRFEFDREYTRLAIYRPFCRQYLYAHQAFIHRPAIIDRYFPHQDTENLCICVTTGAKFGSFIAEYIPDLHLIGDAQCFPLYWYEENKQEQASDLFGNANASRYKRRDGVTDWMLREVRSRFSGARSLTKEDIFYYVYGLLHSTDYRERFADDLRKSLPRIPIVERVEDFMAFSQAGRALAALHLGYESYSAPEGVVVTTAEQPASMDEYDYYRVEKMTFPKGVKKNEESDTIHYNSRITITNIPLEAYDYVVNGKSAIHWVIERYQVSTDEDSGIVNDPNAWSQEQGKPRYILDLLLSVIHVSLESQRIIATLPRLTTL